MAIIFDEQGNLVDTENRVQFGNENFDSEPYQYTPNYLGANSPMLDEGNARLSSLSDYGSDPAFGYLENYYRGSTDYPGSGRRIGYFDDRTKGEVPSLQRALGNERFAMAPEQPDFINAPQDFYQQYSQPQELGYIEPAAVPKEAIYQDRIMNRNLSNSNYEPRQGILQGLQDKIGAGFNNVKDFAMDKGNMGKNLIGAGASKFAGLPGIVGSGAMALMGGLKNQFQDRQLYDDTTDEYGNVYSADELNSQNALGGYYTDAARSARRRTSRVANMLKRQQAGKTISTANLAKLQRQEKIVKKQQEDKQRKIQEAATKRTYSLQNLQDSSDRGTGQNYAAARARTSSRVSPSGRMRAYGLKDGGLASMFTRRR